MKKIPLKQFIDLPPKGKFHRRDMNYMVYEELNKLKVNEAFLIDKKDWVGVSVPAEVVNRKMKKYNKRFTTKSIMTMPEDKPIEGAWAILRIK